MENIAYGVESSFAFEDKDKEYPEQWVVVADGGEEFGTCTCATFSIETPLDEIKSFITFLNNPQF